MCTPLFQGAVPMGEAGWEQARVLAGRPAVDHELTDLYNPLEAGLCSAVSITKVGNDQELLMCIFQVSCPAHGHGKGDVDDLQMWAAVQGCYIGQETLSKLSYLDAVKQQLWGLDLSAPASVGDEVSGMPLCLKVLDCNTPALFSAAGLLSERLAALADGSTKIGTVTSVAEHWDGRPFALGYIRCRSKGAQVPLEGKQVIVGNADATIVSTPFATRTLESQTVPV